MSVKDRIKEVRQALKLTQGEFSKRIALSTSHLAGMELGDKKVNDRVIRLISMEFNVSEHWLKTGSGSMYDDEENINIAKIISLYKSLKPMFRECALVQLSALAKASDSCDLCE
jgi:transcriptional regulator with XRE-family HTH domain